MNKLRAKFTLPELQEQLDDLSEGALCLGLINQAFAEVCDDPTARFCDFDNLGHCLILPDTHSSVAVLWEEMVATKGAQTERAA